MSRKIATIERIPLDAIEGLPWVLANVACDTIGAIVLKRRYSKVFRHLSCLAVCICVGDPCRTERPGLSTGFDVIGDLDSWSQTPFLETCEKNNQRL